MRSVAPTPYAFALALLVAGAPVAAQSPGRAPLTPDSTLAPGPTGEGFAAWRAAIAARGRTGASFLVDGDRYQILVMTPMAIDALAQDSLMVKATRGCMRALALNEEQVLYTAQVDPWVAFDSAAYARPAVALAVYPKEQRRYDCHAGNLARFAAMSRGALYGAFGSETPQEMVGSVEFRRDGLVEPVLLSGRAKVTKVTHTRLLDDGTEHTRIYVDPQAFSPDAEGRVPQLELHVYNPVDPEPDVMRLPERLVRAVWQQLLPWQARGLDAAGAAPTPPPIHFAAPRDSALLAAHESYERGNMGTAASAAMTRLMFMPRPPQAEIRNAMLLSATAFTLRGRDAEALSLMTDIMEVYPCLTLAPEAPESMRELVVALRKPARCTAIPLRVIALRSVIPGYGQATGPLRRRLALTVFISTAAAYLTAEQLRAYGRRSYESYLAYRGGTSPRTFTLYARAQNARTAGNVLTIAAAATWIGAGVEALWTEHQHARRLEEVREVGRRDTNGSGGRRAAAGAHGALVIAPALAADRVGLSVSFR
ncbi:MAG: hypothetical protein K8S21_11870 [Gemmatimonadetes bacterium]|nr:hypothetical protein [Gemmatimonadota bacterium]